MTYVRARHELERFALRKMVWVRAEQPYILPGAIESYVISKKGAAETHICLGATAGREVSILTGAGFVTITSPVSYPTCYTWWPR